MSNHLKDRSTDIGTDFFYSLVDNYSPLSIKLMEPD
jgi:hypothetical protein